MWLADEEQVRVLRAHWTSARVQAFKRRHPAKVVEMSNRRRAAKVGATPSWARQDRIDQVYLECEILKAQGVDCHVDHIVPLLSKLVCGLHCEANLQVITAKENLTKGNRYWPDMP
jgi:hypothetical protein